MGYQLVAEAMQPHWARVLSPRDRLVLISMCLAAMDEADGPIPARRYWGGSGLLMLQLNGYHYEAGDQGYSSSREVVRRALRRLESVGAIQRVKTAANGRRSEYEITLRQHRLPVDEDDEEAHPRAYVGRPSAPTPVGP